MSTNKQLSVFHYRDLTHLDYASSQVFSLQLEDDEQIEIRETLRLMPGKRLVAKAKWRDKTVIAKIFFDGHHALSHINREEKGSKLLRERNILTPSVLYRGASDDRRVHVLVYEYIAEGHSLESIWRQQQGSDQVLGLLNAVIEEIATQHVLGIVQKDCHLDNFLLVDSKIYNIDTAQIKAFPLLLSTRQSMDSLALFLSQLGIGFKKLQMQLLDHYIKTRGWVMSEQAKDEMALLIRKANQHRWQAYQKKIFRDSTEFKKSQSYKRLSVQRRDFAGDEISQFLKDPEYAFSHTGCEILKAGRSSTVIKINLDGRTYVIKRFNLKNTWHRLRRCLRPGRAQHDWRIAQKLALFGIKTAKPIAFIENRFFSLRGKSYYVMEYVEGSIANEYLVQHPATQEKIVKRIVDLLKNLVSIELTHGDLKITNILIDANESPVLIDLDGSQEHVSLSSLHAGWKKEIKRFLRNFDDQEDLKQQFKKYMELRNDKASTEII